MNPFQRNPIRRAVLALFLLSFALDGSAQTNLLKNVSSGAASDWVKPQMFARTVSLPFEPGEEERWLISEQQANVANNETFFHSARLIRTPAGVQDGSNINIDFNPSYETLTIHWVRLWRGTNLLNRLNLDHIKLIRQERDLQDQMLDGRHTAVLVLEDVRAGDIVDYAYTVKGSNPVLDGMFSLHFAVQFSHPIERLLTRIVAPPNRRLFIKPFGTTAQPKISATKQSTEYVWDLRQIPTAKVEDSLPAWFNPGPWVQVTECQSWAQVNQWALKLFSNPGTPSPELLQKISEWRRIQSREEQVLSILRFVQDEVRYFAMELGENTHRPAEPATVFTKRYGDCKDKALLFVTLLRTLGIEAYPVLVNSEARQTLDAWLPDPIAFSHCIAQVRYNGRTYYFDTTISYQRGSLANHYLPNYARGLVIASGTKALSVIPPNFGSPMTSTTEYYQLGNRNQAADFRVVTVANGRDADALRAYFASTKRSEIEQSYLHYYSPSFHGLHQAQPLTITDNEAQNRIEITEFYTIDQPWTMSPNDQRWRFMVYPYAIDSALKQPRDTVRTMPIGLSFPQHQLWRAEVNLPFSVLDLITTSVNDAAFTFRKDYRPAGNRIALECEYESFTDTVPVVRSTEYINHVEEALTGLGYHLMWPEVP